MKQLRILASELQSQSIAWGVTCPTERSGTGHIFSDDTPGSLQAPGPVLHAGYL